MYTFDLSQKTETEYIVQAESAKEFNLEKKREWCLVGTIVFSNGTAVMQKREKIALISLYK